jgi:hypothetical protein
MKRNHLECALEPVMLTMCICLTLLLLATQASAESVYVKYRGVVDLKSFNCTETQSSVVHRICYQEKSQYLIVLLGNVYYHYCRISPLTVGEWLEAESKGKFYNAQIKGNFDCRLGGVPETGQN